MTPDIALLLIPVLPFCAALAGYLLQRRVPARYLAWLGALSLGLSAVLGLNLILLLQQGVLKGSATFSRPWFILPDGAVYYMSRGSQQGLPVPFTLDAGLAQLLFVAVTGLVAAGVVLYAARERMGDERAGVFHATLTLFAGSMLLFLCSDTLLVLYIAWELMGVCSYLLIGYRGTSEARRAARQAFWTTRATDFGLLFAVLAMMMRFKWAAVSDIDVAAALNNAVSNQLDPVPLISVLGFVALLLLLACIGKAAQLPLSFWLPDAMVAPAPVSALLHAATMVAAGPFLLIQLAGLFQPVALPGQEQVMLLGQLPLILAVLAGGLTLVLGGCMALVATEPKRVLAYSTVSQLGLVVMSVGALAEEAGLYHLVGHALFKASLFLAVGYAVIAAARAGSSDAKEAHGETLQQLAGSVRGALPRWTLLLAGLSLAGVAPLAGALGKEQVLYALIHRAASEPRPGFMLGSLIQLSTGAWAVGLVLFLLALPITAAYITRLVGMLCFAGEAAAPPGQRSAAAAGSPPAERGWALPLWLAFVLALLGSAGWGLGYIWFSSAFSKGAAWKWGAMLSGEGLAGLLASQLLVWGGIGLSWYLHVARPSAAEQLLQRRWLKPLAGFFANGMYLRELFTTLVGRTGELLAILCGMAEISVLEYLTQGTGRFGRWLAGASRWIDDHVVDGARYRVCQVAWLLRAGHARYWQTGQIQQYMFIILLSALALCLIALGPLARRLAEILGSL